MFKKLMTDAIIKILRSLGRYKVVYPKSMYHRTRAKFIERAKKHNKK